MTPVKVWIGCSVCGAKVACTRYRLQGRIVEGGELRNRGAGAISLCQQCWERIAKPSMYRGDKKQGKGQRPIVLPGVRRTA